MNRVMQGEVMFTREYPSPMSAAWLRKAFELVRNRVVPCARCRQPMMVGGRCGSCGHTLRHVSH